MHGFHVNESWLAGYFGLKALSNSISVYIEPSPGETENGKRVMISESKNVRTIPIPLLSGEFRSKQEVTWIFEKKKAEKHDGIARHLNITHSMGPILIEAQILISRC